MIRTLFYSFWASFLTASWLEASLTQTALITTAVAPLVTLVEASATWLGGYRQRRRRQDASRLFDNICPACHDEGTVEVTSGREITCTSCHTRYYVDSDGLVTRRGKTSKQVPGGAEG